MLIRNLAFFCLVVIFAVFVFMVETGYKSTENPTQEVTISTINESESTTLVRESAFERKVNLSEESVWFLVFLSLAAVPLSLHGGKDKS